MEVRLEPGPAMPMPTGTVTFLFSDVEGSTLRWEHDRANMEAAVRRHDAVVRNAIVARHGFVFKTVGDAFCAVFARPDEAVAAALEAQRALLAEDFSAVDGLPVRMALHTGTAEERDGDYFGPTVNRVSRLLAIGNGGQILVSGVTTDLVQGTLPSQASLQDLGAHRLRDLTYPEQVYQLVAPGLRADFPALRSLEVLPNNLPLQLTSFVGRDREVGEIESLLKKHRVVTIVGSGGVGKTRASLQVGANLLDGSGDGAWFVELAPLADGSVIPTAIASAVGIDLPAGVALDALVAKLKAKHLLLILDNCEHLVEETARVVDALVRGCPNVVVLASSRQGLGIAGEATYRMPSLSVPDATGSVGLATADLRRYGAIALFVERAEAADQQFTLTNENAPAVADICRRLDGIAFAIELAAARVRMLSPQQLQRRLDERFRILTGGSRTALPRQQTLRALIDWSYELLDARERALFRRVGVFVDGFSIEGASAVCTDATFDELELFDVLASLVDKSLVVAELSGPATRYRLLESTRAYALEKLAEADESKRLLERHLAYIHELAMRAAESYQAMDTAEPFAAIETELENVRAAVAYALNGGTAQLGAEIAYALNDEVLSNAELAKWYEAFVDLVDEGDLRLRANLTTRLATMLAATGRTERAREVAQGGMVAARSTDDPATIFESLMRHLSLLRRSRSFDTASAEIAEAETLLASVDTPRRRLQFLQNRGLVAGQTGDLETATRDFTEIQRLCRLYANENSSRNIVINFAEFEHQLGNTARAIEMIADALPAQRRKRSLEVLANVLVNGSAYCFAEDRFAESATYTDEALRIGKENSAERLFVTIAIQQTAALLAVDGRFGPAARLEGYAAANYAHLGFEPEYTERVTQQRLHGLLANIPEAERAKLLAEGAALSLEAALDEAIVALGSVSPAAPGVPHLRLA